MEIKRTDSNGREMVITLTAEEKEQVYRDVQNEYRLEDAKNHLTEYFFPNDYKPSAELLNQFRAQNGVAFEALTDPASDLCILQDIVDCYEDRHDCNVPENDMYEAIIGNYIQRNPLLSQFRIQEDLIPSDIRKAAVQELREKHPDWSSEDRLAYIFDLTDEELQRGYWIVDTHGQEGVVSGAFIVEKIDILDRFESDYEAAKQAEKDGIQIIHDMPDLEDWTYVDTPENRAICAKALSQQKTSLDTQIKSAQSEVKPAEREGEALADRAR